MSDSSGLEQAEQVFFTNQYDCDRRSHGRGARQRQTVMQLQEEMASESDGVGFIVPMRMNSAEYAMTSPMSVGISCSHSICARMSVFLAPICRSPAISRFLGGESSPKNLERMTRLIKSKSEMHNTWWIVPVGNIGQIKAKATAKKGLALSLSMESHLNSMQSHTNTLTRSERAGE